MDFRPCSSETAAVFCGRERRQATLRCAGEGGPFLWFLDGELTTSADRIRLLGMVPSGFSCPNRPRSSRYGNAMRAVDRGGVRPCQVLVGVGRGMVPAWSKNYRHALSRKSYLVQGSYRTVVPS